MQMPEPDQDAIARRAEIAAALRRILPAESIIDEADGRAEFHIACDEQGEPLRIVHRDVSPHNVLVGVDGAAHVIDFGIAKARGRMQVTRDGQIKGKLSYMPPEQLLGQGLDHRADVFAASIVFWVSRSCSSKAARSVKSAPTQRISRSRPCSSNYRLFVRL